MSYSFQGDDGLTWPEIVDFTEEYTCRLRDLKNMKEELCRIEWGYHTLQLHHSWTLVMSELIDVVVRGLSARAG